jgi:amino acid transporter
VRLMVFETLVVVALSGTILVTQAAEPGALNLGPFDPHQGNGMPGFWAAMILGVLAFCGFDVVSTAAEEADAPRQHVPKAILLTVVGIAVFWAVNSWVFTLSTSTADVREYTAHGLTAVTPMAQKYWGYGNLIVIITAFTGLTAVYISSVQGASRIVFSLARHGLLPAALASLAGEKRVPRNAVLSALVAVVVLDVGSLYILGRGLDSFTWWANALVFFAALTFLAVNVANPLLLRRVAPERFGVFKNVLVPVVGVALNAYLIYAAFFSSLWGQDWRTGKSVVIGSVGLLAVEVIGVVCMRVFRPGVFSQDAPMGAGGAEIPPQAALSSRGEAGSVL